MRSVTIKGQETGHRPHFLQSETNFRQENIQLIINGEDHSEEDINDPASLGPWTS